MLNLLNEFQLIIQALEEEKIDYAVCGGMAMAIHGFLRATVDIDIVLMQESIERTKLALHKYGYLIESAPMRFADGNIIIHRITKTDASSEDFLVLNIPEVTDAMKEIWKNRKRIEWNFGFISIIDKSGLIQMKKMRNSKVDQEDIERLEKMDKTDMSPNAVTMRIEKLSQLRELCLTLKQAGQKAGLHDDSSKKELQKGNSIPTLLETVQNSIS